MMTDDQHDTTETNFTVSDYRRSIRQQIGRSGDRLTALRRSEVRDVYEQLAGRTPRDDMTLPELRHRVIELLAGVETRSQYASAYSFRRDELKEIDEQLRAAMADNADPDLNPDAEAAPDDMGDDE